jgi:C-terminal processing protease CtpA/Prc
MVWFESLPASEALLVQVNQPRPDSVGSVVATLASLYGDLSTHRYRRIVIDLRGNEGGWYSLTSALPGIIGSIEAGSNPPAVFVLIGPDTTSAGVALAAQMEQQTNAVFVGEPTGSAPNMFGTYKPAQLPNSGIYYRVSTRRLVNSLPEDDRLWIAPDVIVAERVEDILRGVDSALEKALSLPLDAATPSSLEWFKRWSRPSQGSARLAAQQRHAADGAARRR